MLRATERAVARQRRPRRAAVLTAVVAVIAAAGPALSVPAQAAAPSAPTRPTGATAQDGPTQQALAQAKKTGKPVTVDALTTETAVTVANPDGKTFTRTSNIQPVRVQKGGAWVATDATLAKNADGTFSPAATPSGVTLSGGGTAPLAAFKDKAGHQFAMTLPFALPKPTVNGNTATYADVLPGVDLQATVTDQGAFHEVLVVKNAQAAANPQLKTLKLATTTNGLTTSTDTDGNLTVKTPDGTEAFHAPAPVMWDSAALAAPGGVPAQADAAAAEAAPKAPPISPAAPPAPPSAVDPAGRIGSSKDGPGHGAHISKLNVKADNGSVTLAPDADQLAHATYPAFIDPTVAPGGGTNHYLEVKEGCAGQSLYDNAQENGEGVGYQQYDSNCFGLYRSFYEMDTSFFNSSTIVVKSTLTLAETYGADHGCPNTWGIGLRLTGGIANGTNWGSQPGQVQDLGQTTVKSAYFGCGTQYVNFDVTGPVGQYRGYPNLTFGIYGQENKYATNYGFMRFSTNPQLSTQYEIAPNTPDSVSVSQANANCSGGTPGWLGATAGPVSLSARLTTGMPGVNLTGGSKLLDNTASDGNGNPYTDGWPASPGAVGSGGTVSIPTPVPWADGHQYSWQVWANDGYMAGPAATPCVFDVDLTPPSVATFTPSSDFPPLGSGITPNKHAGDGTVSIQVSSTDPTPTWGCVRMACVKSGVTAFQWSLDTNVPPSGANTIPVTPDGNGTATASVPITLTAAQWGTHTLYVRALDGAGNTQATVASYSFYAPWNQNAVAVAGDLTGDGVPDTLVPDPNNNGNLTLIPGGKDMAAAPLIASAANQSPDGTGWNNYLVTHRGSQTQSILDDIFAYQKQTKQLYLYRNDGTVSATSNGPGVAGRFTLTQDVMVINKPTGCANVATGSGCPTDWSGLTQMVAPGANALGKNMADLITVENNQLWYYPGSARGGAYLGRPYLIGSGDWSGTTLIAPGSVGATVTSGLPRVDFYGAPVLDGNGNQLTYTGETGGTPTLWARDNTTGAVVSYPLTFDGNGIPTSNLTAPSHTALTTGLKAADGSPICADMSHGNSADGTPVEIWGCVAGAYNQQWTLGADQSVHVLGKCLDVNHNGTANGSTVQIWTCNGGTNQQWVPGPNNTLRNPVSGRCLGDNGGGNAAGTTLIIWDCNGNPDQQWTFPAQPGQTLLPIGVGSDVAPTVVSPGDVNGDGNPELYAISGSTGADQVTVYPGAAPSNGIAQFATPVGMGTEYAPVGVTLHSVYAPSKCVDDNNSQTANGTPIDLYDCNGGGNQVFNFNTDGTLRYAGMKCVAADGAGTALGTKAVLTDCLPGHPEQQWTFNHDGRIVNKNSGLCLEINNWDTTNGRQLDTWTCVDQTNTAWSLSTNH
ncbi:ricin-type beta-trefoil lectin domain protein [Kitasatospora sp. NPDC058965]|uniref:ricin-type beta-trefoil lectin domain protein n=1 Tax=Kitasatospora sp. NPDC058965 TaxID=3346682 RepID=UPI0036BA6792